ncbi:hypothetical protein CRG98_006866 [Punica granatum]|uniref:Uncharacterized protein n=1 Tax=Punica granatum TaxID=22663 RepID=A0A2I0KWE5_PUNGR|nr:hypothetical protein CRG98_006866 [Punica granatum]
MESLRDGGDLLRIDKVEKHRLHKRHKALKFLISNVTFYASALVKQIKGTCREQVEKSGRKSLKREGEADSGGLANGHHTSNRGCQRSLSYPTTQMGRDGTTFDPNRWGLTSGQHPSNRNSR